MLMILGVAVFLVSGILNFKAVRLADLFKRKYEINTFSLKKPELMSDPVYRSELRKILVYRRIAALLLLLLAIFFFIGIP